MSDTHTWRRLLAALLVAWAFAPRLMAQAMTDEEVISHVQTELARGQSQQSVVADLLKRGVTTAQLQRVRRKAQQMRDQGGVNAVAGGAGDSRLRQNSAPDGKDTPPEPRDGAPEPVNERGLSVDDPSDSMLIYMERLTAEPVRVFGRDIFSNKSLTFEPAANMATPESYRLGAGDAVNIDIWGASQQSLTRTVSPDGTVIVDGVGPLRLGGMTVGQARQEVRSRLGRYYAGCQFDLTLGQTRTVQVQVMGEVRVPGTYSLSGLASAFNALYAAGGVSDIGTLRDIKVYRGGREAATIDVYDYLVNGNQRGDIRLEDNDVIIVGPYDCLVRVSGKVKRPMYYEMRGSETAGQLLRYAGGFLGDAHTGSVRVLRKAGSERSIHTVEEFAMGAFTLRDGDEVEVDSVPARYSNMVEARGAVRLAGKYELGGQTQTVAALLRAAGGLREDAYGERAVMRREKDDLTLETVTLDLAGILSGQSADVPLKRNDILFVPSKTEMLGDRTVSVGGEVTYPGTYPWAENTTLRDIILQAGGLTDAASLARVDVFRRVRDVNALQDSESSAESFSFALDETFGIVGDTAFTLRPYDVVTVRKSPAYEPQRNVSVYGCVNFAGSYTLTKKDYRLTDLVRACGGFTGLAYAKGARLTRKMTPDEKLQRDKAQQQAQIQLYEQAMKEGGAMNRELADTLLSMKMSMDDTYPVALDMTRALAEPGGPADIVLREGDAITVPQFSNTVKVSGEVSYPISMNYVKGKSLGYYISHAGGYASRAKKGRVYAVYANGGVEKVSRRSSRDIEPGCEIVVPAKDPHKGMTTGEIVSLSSGAASLASVIVALISILK